jgi:integrase
MPAKRAQSQTDFPAQKTKIAAPKVRVQVGKNKTTYLARVRRNGITDTATFDKLSDATNWVREQESKIFTGKPVDVSKVKRAPLSKIFQDYIQNGKLNAEKEARMERLTQLIGKVKLREFDSTSLEKFLDAMKDTEVPRPEHWKTPHPYFNGSMVEIDGKLVRRKFSPSTIRKYYYAIRTCLMWHAKRHNYHFDNKPFQDNPPPPAWEKPRDRVVELADGELDRLLNACELMRTKSEHYKDIIQFQIHSAMRMGETLQMTWEQIHINKKEPWKSFIFIPKSHQKTRKHDSTDDRNVNMVPELVALVKERLLPRAGGPTELVFPFWKTSTDLSKRMRVIWKNAGIKDMRAHDFRHTGVTRLFADTNLTDIEIAKITAHSDLNTLKRYHKARPSEIGAKMWRSMGAFPEKGVKSNTRKRK